MCVFVLIRFTMIIFNFLNYRFPCCFLHTNINTNTHTLTPTLTTQSRENASSFARPQCSQPDDNDARHKQRPFATNFHRKLELNLGRATESQHREHTTHSLETHRRRSRQAMRIFQRRSRAAPHGRRVCHPLQVARTCEVSACCVWLVAVDSMRVNRRRQDRCCFTAKYHHQQRKARTVALRWF